jgi:hypothetical protein
MAGTLSFTDFAWKNLRRRRLRTLLTLGGIALDKPVGAKLRALPFADQALRSSFAGGGFGS